MDTKTLRCGLLGRKLGHSYSPAIHERLADYSYRLFEVEPEDLGAFLQEGAFDGLNVTIPYKKDVIPYCAELSDTARAIGAVNTLVLGRRDQALERPRTPRDRSRCSCRACSSARYPER